MKVAGKILIATSIGLVGWLWLAPTAIPEHATAAAPVATLDGKTLFANHCAACHGDQGDGNGIAARFLYPKPRDFTAAEFRVVSTTNLVPSEDDLVRIITRGMPGSAMFPFGHLTEAERIALAKYVMELTRDGMVRKAVADAKAQGETPDEADIRRQATELLTPGPKLDLPQQWPVADAASIARGLTIYKASCATCHGDTGKGDGAQDQLDTTGVPIRPRDFGRGIFKGGRDRDQLYARIVLGMKGTPMTANTLLKPEQVGDVINFVHSIAPADAQAKVEHTRKLITARKFPRQFPADLSEVWRVAPAEALVVSPLWWTDRPDADLKIAAAHDGKTLAFRLSWADASCNDVIHRPQDFEDMASVQIFNRRPEPFLGMGAPGAVPDLWLWRATWGKPRDNSLSMLDQYPFADRPPGQPDQLTPRAAGNLHARPDETVTASDLGAKGPGSITFRPKASQHVTAKASWSAGRWSVEFRRPLIVSPDDGIPLTSGATASIAAALWDGAVRDRNGQKQVSIWHDLRIE